MSHHNFQMVDGDSRGLYFNGDSDHQTCDNEIFNR